MKVNFFKATPIFFLEKRLSGVDSLLAICRMPVNACAYTLCLVIFFVHMSNSQLLFQTFQNDSVQIVFL